MIPVARSKKLKIQRFKGQALIYDLELERVICLNILAALVWHCCNGNNTLPEIARFLEREIETEENIDWMKLVWLTLDMLDKCFLIATYRTQKKLLLSRIKPAIADFEAINCVNKPMIIQPFPVVKSFSLSRESLKLVD